MDTWKIQSEDRIHRPGGPTMTPVFIDLIHLPPGEDILESLRNKKQILRETTAITRDQFDIQVNDRNTVKLTIAKDRVTVKLPKTLAPVEREQYLKEVEAVLAVVEVTQTLRGVFQQDRLMLSTDSKRVIYYFDRTDGMPVLKHWQK